MKKLLETVNKNDVEQVNETVLHEDDHSDIAYELEEIKEQIQMLVGEAMDMIPRDGMYAARARSYWYAHILTALDNESEFMGGSMTTMQDTIDELREAGGSEDDGDDMDPGYNSTDLR